MKTSHLRRWAVAGLLAGLIGVLVPQTTVFAADTPAFPSNSDAPVYLVNGNANTNYTPGSELAWNPTQGAYLSAASLSSTPSDYETARLPFVTGAEQAITFIAKPGEERDRTKWKAWSDLVNLNGKGVLLPQVTPAYQGYGFGASDESASTLATALLKSAGGTYSLGVAYVKDSGRTVVSAYFTSISVTAGSGAWKFASPGDVTPTPTPTPTPTSTPTSPAATTLTVSATKATYVGDPITISAVISPSAVTGSVGIYDGTKLLRSVALSNGRAQLATSGLAAGTHTIKAVFGGNSSYAAATSNTITIKLVKKATFKKTGSASISGTAKVGKKLTAKTGTWSPKASFRYQWLVNGKSIAGATKSTFKIAKAQKGKKITVKVTGSRTGYVSVTKTSKATKKVK